LQEAENQIVIEYEVYDRRPNDSDLLVPAIETHLTPAQLAWMKQNVEDECIGPPRPRVKFTRCGTLHDDGTFEPLRTLVAVKHRSDCMSVLVGAAVKPMSELR
jgi:hypothetical protein